MVSHKHYKEMTLNEMMLFLDCLLYYVCEEDVVRDHPNESYHFPHIYVSSTLYLS